VDLKYLGNRYKPLLITILKLSNNACLSVYRRFILLAWLLLGVTLMSKNGNKKRAKTFPLLHNLTNSCMACIFGAANKSEWKVIKNKQIGCQVKLSNNLSFSIFYKINSILKLGHINFRLTCTGNIEIQNSFTCRKEIEIILPEGCKQHTGWIVERSIFASFRNE